MIPVKKLLVVNDGFFMRKAITKALSHLENVEIFEASDGVEALQKIDENEPDIVLLDLLMPKMGGIDLLKTLQARGEPRLGPNLIVLSAMLDPVVLAQLQPLGVSLVLSAPFHILELLETIRDIVDNPGLDQTPNLAEPSLNIAPVLAG